MDDGSFQRRISRLSDHYIFAPIISLLYPQDCALCGGLVTKLQLGRVCEQCWPKTVFFDQNSPLCEKCGAFDSNNISRTSIRCGRCNEHSFDRAFAIGPYENGLRSTVLSLKSTPHFPPAVADQAATRLNGLNVVFDLIVPVPLSKRRRFERGFNQAEVIADVVSRLTRVPVDRNSLQRKTHTQMHRVGMDQKAREKTVEKAFTVARPKMIAGKNVLLTDDVFTSGATASACAQILKSHAAKSVAVFTIARAEFRMS